MRSRHLVPFAALLAIAALAQPAPPDAGTPQLTKAPVLVRFIEAVYPPEAQAAGRTARVVLQLDLSPEGAVDAAEVTQSAGPDFDSAALAAVKQFQFEPAEVDFKPAAVRLSYAYQFMLREAVALDGGAGDDAGVAPVNFSGLVRERGSRTPLVGAAVTLPGELGAEFTDATGRFAFRGVPPGALEVKVTQPDHQRFATTETIAAGLSTEVTYYMQRLSGSQFETVVQGTKEKKQVSQQVLQVDEIQKIPGTQGDTLKVVQNLPGVARSSFNTGALVIRGTNANDSGVFLDGLRIPLLYHFAGLTSVYNSDLLESVSFLPGNYSGFYGDLVGGVVDVKSRAPRKDRFGGYANLSLIDASALVEGPLGDDVSFAVSGRRSYIDAFLGLIPSGSAAPNFQVAPRYYDAQLKVEWRINRQHTLTLLAITSDDQLSLLFDRPSSADPASAGAFYLHTGFTQVRLRHQLKSGPWRLDTTAMFGLATVVVKVGSAVGLEISSQEYALRSTLEYEVLPELTLAGGVEASFQPAKITATLTRAGGAQTGGPPMGPPISDSTAQTTSIDGTFGQYYPGVWAEARLKLFGRWLLVPGLRGDSYVFTEATGAKRTLSPRLGTRLDLGQQVTLKGGVGLYHGAPSQGEPTRAFGNPDILPKRALQVSGGVEWVPTFYSPLFVSVEGFYNRLDQLIVNNPDRSAVARGGPVVTNDGIGRAFGLEVLLRHQLSKGLFGWVAYTLSRSERIDAPGQQWTLFSNDQTHVLTAILSYELPYDFTVGVRFRYASGNPYTPVVGARRNDLTDTFSPLSGPAFSQRLPSFNQADLRIDKKFVFDLWTLTIYLDITNVYNNASVEGVTYNYNFTDKAFFTGLPIIPNLGLKGAF